MQLEAGCKYYRLKSQGEAGYMVLANPCNRIRLNWESDLLHWWEAVKHFVLAKFPFPDNCETEVHLITEAITTTKWLRYYQSQGTHEAGIKAMTGVQIPGMLSATGKASSSFVKLHTTSGLEAESVEGSGEHVCFTSSLSFKRKLFRRTGIGWAIRAYQLTRPFTEHY